MIKKIGEILMPPAKRKRRVLDNVRRQFSDCGYSVDDLTDSQLEAAITGGIGGVEKIPPLTSRTIYWTLRRLSADERELRNRKIKRLHQTQKAGYS
jgi:hypothetical protein